jgi:hypothetical protein
VSGRAGRYLVLVRLEDVLDGPLEEARDLEG